MNQNLTLTEEQESLLRHPGLMTIPGILEVFRINDGIYKRRHVDAAAKLRDEITPRFYEDQFHWRKEKER